MMTNQKLSDKVTKAGSWLVVLKLFDGVFRYAKLLILARILSSSDFGLMGLALIVMGMVDRFTSLGFKTALIQKKENVEQYFNAAWTIALLRGVSLFTLLYFSAPYVGIFFKTPSIVPIIRVMGFCLLMDGAVNIGVVHFRKELVFNKIFIYRFCALITDATVTITVAIIYKTVWALVLGLLAKHCTLLIASYFVHPYRPRLNFNFEKIKELFRFGKWVIGGAFLLFLITQGPPAYVGKYIGIAALGFYKVAQNISNMLTNEISNTVFHVVYPAFSKLQSNVKKLCEAYLITLQLILLVIVPVIFGILILGPEFVKIFLGNKWAPIIPIMRILIIASIFNSIESTSRVIFFAIGKPKISTYIQLMWSFLLLVFVPFFAAKWELLGVSFAIVLSVVISCIGVIYMILKMLKCKMKDFSKIFILPFISGVVMISFVTIYKNAFPIVTILEFIFSVGIGGIAYISTFYLIDTKFKCGITLFIKNRISGIGTTV